MNEANLIRASIRDVADFPKPGILFKDITPVLSDGQLFRKAVGLFTDACRDLRVDKVVGIDARGFIFGAAAAHAMGVGFTPVRKKGKLPYRTRQVAYALEYGEATVELHVDAIQKGERVVIMDDLLATGGTAAASASLVREMGAELIEIQFLIELGFLKGREKLTQAPVRSFIQY